MLRQIYGFDFSYKEMINLCNKVNKKNDQISMSHELNLIVADVIKYKSGSTTIKTSAQKALAKERCMSRLCAYFDYTSSLYWFTSKIY